VIDARSRGGIGRRSDEAAERLSLYLRQGRDVGARRRRRLAALDLTGAAAMAAVALYQFGVVEHLPEPPLSLLGSDEVDAAGEAYVFLHAPDAALGLVSYGLTSALAGMGAPGRARERPWSPIALAAKVAVDALAGVLLTVEQATKHRKFCFYCLLATGASVAGVPLALAEAREAIAALRAER
jgi:hypothetical protein